MSQQPHEDWVENLRDLYLIKQPDEDGMMTVNVTMQKQDFYMIGKEALEDWIRIHKAAWESAARAKLLKELITRTVEVYGEDAPLDHIIRSLSHEQEAQKED